MRHTTFLALAVLAVTACSGTARDAGSTSTGGHPHEQALDPGVTAPVDLPAEFPATIPIPAGLAIQGADVLDGRSQRLFDITGWHAASAVATGTEYLAELEELGFEVTSRSDADTSVFFIAEDPRWLVSAGFFPDPVRLEGTSVGITVSPRAD